MSCRALIILSLHLAVQRGELKRGQVCLLLGTGGGFSVGAFLFEY